MEWFRFGLFLCIFFKSGFMLSVRNPQLEQAIDRIYKWSFFFKDLNTKALPTDLTDYRYLYIDFLDSFHLYSSAAYAGLDICGTYDLRFLFSIRWKHFVIESIIPSFSDDHEMGDVFDFEFVREIMVITDIDKNHITCQELNRWEIYSFPTKRANLKYMWFYLCFRKVKHLVTNWISSDRKHGECSNSNSCAHVFLAYYTHVQMLCW